MGNAPTPNEFPNVDAIRNTRLRMPGGQTVRLSDIANIADSVAERRDTSRIDDVPPVSSGTVRRTATAVSGRRAVPLIVITRFASLEIVVPVVGLNGALALIDPAARRPAAMRGTPDERVVVDQVLGQWRVLPLAFDEDRLGLCGVVRPRPCVIAENPPQAGRVPSRGRQSLAVVNLVAADDIEAPASHAEGLYVGDYRDDMEAVDKRGHVPVPPDGKRVQTARPRDTRPLLARGTRRRFVESPQHLHHP